MSLYLEVGLLGGALIMELVSLSEEIRKLVLSATLPLPNVRTQREGGRLQARKRALTNLPTT